MLYIWPCYRILSSGGYSLYIIKKIYKDNKNKHTALSIYSYTHTQLYITTRRDMAHITLVQKMDRTASHTYTCVHIHEYVYKSKTRPFLSEMA